MQKGTLIKVKIDKVGFQGIGIGVLDQKLNPDADIPKDEFGKKVLIQNTLPGEIVIAKVFRNKKKFTDADKIETIEFSPMSVTPRCKHFEICGGCKWQNLSYEEQLKIKQTHVIETLTHLGGFDEEMINKLMRPILPCENQWQYRNKVELSFGWDANMEPSFGFHAENRRYDIFNIKECHLMSDRMFEIALAIKNFAEQNKLTAYKFREGIGLLRSATIREAKNTGEILVNLEMSNEEFSDELRNKFVKSLENFNIDSIFITQVITARGSKTERKETLLHGKPTITEKMNINNQVYTFHISPSSFFQTNTEQAEKLYEKTFENLDLKSDDTVLDLFCGTGTIGIIAAKFVNNVIGIELNPDAVIDADKNAELNQEPNIEFITGDVGKILENFEIEGRLNALQGKKIIVDPPRSGLTPKMIEYILKLRPTHISYVSCNPTTQARDIKELFENGYQITLIQPVDMFPHTYHIENVIGLTYSPISG